MSATIDRLILAGALVAALLAGCSGPTAKPEVDPAAKPRQQPPIVEPKPTKLPPRVVMIDEALSLKAFPNTMAVEAMTGELLDDPTWPKEVAKWASADPQSARGALVFIPIGPTSATVVAAFVGWVSEKHPFCVEKVDLRRARGDWEGTVYAAPITFDPTVNGEPAQKGLEALRAYREMRGEARKQVANALAAHPLAQRIVVEWDASDSEYEIEVTEEQKPGRGAVEPRPRLRPANEVLGEKADEYFAIEEEGGKALARLRELAPGVSFDAISGKDVTFHRAQGLPVPLVAAEVKFEADAPSLTALAATFDAIEDDKRFFADEVAIGRRKVDAGKITASGVVFALAVAREGLDGAAAQAALDAVKEWDAGRPRTGKLLGAALAALPPGLELTAFKKARAVELAVAGPQDDSAKKYADALAQEPAFAGLKLSEISPWENGVIRIVFEPK